MDKRESIIKKTIVKGVPVLAALFAIVSIRPFLIDAFAAGETLAFCHCAADLTPTQLNVLENGIEGDDFWCRKQGNNFQTRFDAIVDIPGLIAAKPGSYDGVCGGDDDMTYCQFKNGAYNTKTTTAANLAARLAQWPGSHANGCHGHELDVMDYYGICTVCTAVASTFVPPPPPTPGEKREGIGTGTGPPGSRKFTPRVLPKSRKLDNK